MRDGALLDRRTAVGAEAEALRREAAILAHCRHPGIVELVAATTTAGQLTVTTAATHGTALAVIQLSIEEVAGVSAALATTVADLHDIGVAHGALDVRRIIVDTEGRPVLLDFSHASWLDGPPPRWPGHRLARADDRALGAVIGSVLARCPQGAGTPVAQRLSRRRRLHTRFDAQAAGTILRSHVDSAACGSLAARALAEALACDVPGSRLPQRRSAPVPRSGDAVIALPSAGQPEARTGADVGGTVARAGQGGSDVSTDVGGTVARAGQGASDLASNGGGGGSWDAGEVGGIGPDGSPDIDGARAAGGVVRQAGLVHNPVMPGHRRWVVMPLAGIMLAAGSLGILLTAEHSRGRSPAGSMSPLPALGGRPAPPDPSPEARSRRGTQAVSVPAPQDHRGGARPEEGPARTLPRRGATVEAATTATTGFVATAPATTPSPAPRSTAIAADPGAAPRGEASPSGPSTTRSTGEPLCGLPGAVVSEAQGRATWPTQAAGPGAPDAPGLPPAPCETFVYAGGVLTVGPDRFAVGQPGDVVTPGRWSCRPTPAIALLRPATGDVWVFDGWPSGPSPLAAVPMMTVYSATSLTPAAEGGCDALLVGRADGTSIVIRPWERGRAP